MKTVIINVSVFRRELLEQMHREVHENKDKHKSNRKGA